MKTSNKTHRKFSGIIILLILGLVATNLTAQKSYSNYTLASLGGSIAKNSKFDIFHTETANHFKYTPADKDLIEDWMKNPSDWNANYNLNLIKEESFEESEMILEDWMMKTNWEENSLPEEEMQIEEWMMQTDWAISNLTEKELEIEDWMSKPLSWNI
jgi:hypothetical protein